MPGRTLIENGCNIAGVRFSDRAEVEPVWKDVEAGHIRCLDRLLGPSLRGSGSTTSPEGGGVGSFPAPRLPARPEQSENPVARPILFKANSPNGANGQRSGRSSTFKHYDINPIMAADCDHRSRRCGPGGRNPFGNPAAGFQKSRVVEVSRLSKRGPMTLATTARPIHWQGEADPDSPHERAVNTQGARRERLCEHSRTGPAPPPDDTLVGLWTAVGRLSGRLGRHRMPCRPL